MRIYFLTLLITGFMYVPVCKGQLVITDEPNPQLLAQKLVGQGVSISNVTFTGNALMAGYFKNIGGTNINIDSGIVLTSGRAKTSGTNNGLNGNGTTQAQNVLANNSWMLPGDGSLASAIGADVALMEDACVLEFDFVPAGDTIRFNYIFSSEEYEPAFACSNFIDAFGFFVSGPGITGQQNIALVPATSLPVSILNVNNVIDNGVPLCPLNPGFYIDNTTNTNFNHEGHTVVLTAIARVQPCNTYHLKLVVSDNNDDNWDSGVFLEAGSLNSNIVQFTNQTQVDPATDSSYIVEGCVSGSFRLTRPIAANYPLPVVLSYSGTAINGVDVQTLPAVAIIPANQASVVVNVIPIIDNLPEGIEQLRVYAFANCGNGSATDSTIIQIRDYDILGLTPDSAIICRGSSIQLNASAGYLTYNWTNTPGLSSYTGLTPTATPVTNQTTYICTATVGTCNAQDSVYLEWKSIVLDSVTHVNCQNAETGEIFVSNFGDWIAPVQYTLNNGPAQTSGYFNNLGTGNYIVRISDGTNCIDSVIVNIIQSYPNLVITDTAVTPASCSGNPDGTITVTVSGGKTPYRYSANGSPYQLGNILNVRTGTYTIMVKDSNNCEVAMENVFVPFVNSVTVQTGAPPTICESLSAPLPATTNANSVSWVPVNTLNDPRTLNPVANPVVTTTYYVTATTGICQRTDSIIVFVNPAPVPNAGIDTTVCYGGSITFNGTGGVQYQWTPSLNMSNAQIANPVISNLEGPQNYYYSLSVIDANGCSSLQNDTMKLYIPPPAKLYAGRDTSVAISQPLQLNAIDINNIGFINYAWTPGENLNNAFIPNPIATLTAAETMFIVAASTAANCTGVDTIIVKTYLGPTIYVPSCFTPNGDGKNDVIKPFTVGIRSFGYFKIFNRYGQLVFTSTNQNQGWDGRLKGAKQTMSSFVWIATGIDYKGNFIQRQGTFTLAP